MRILFSFLISLVLFSSCKDKCKDVDCPENIVYSITCKIQDFTTHEDIFYSNNPLYDKNNFKIFAIENSDTVYYSINQNEADSTFSVSFQGMRDLFFEVNANDIDTVKISFNNIESYYFPNEPVCCPNNKIITSMNYNNDPSFNPTENGVIFYKH